MHRHEKKCICKFAKLAFISDQNNFWLHIALEEERILPPIFPYGIFSKQVAQNPRIQSLSSTLVVFPEKKSAKSVSTILKIKFMKKEKKAGIIRSVASLSDVYNINCELEMTGKIKLLSVIGDPS